MLACALGSLIPASSSSLSIKSFDLKEATFLTILLAPPVIEETAAAPAPITFSGIVVPDTPGVVILSYAPDTAATPFLAVSFILTPEKSSIALLISSNFACTSSFFKA